ncbi:MAG TPA: c-type cytochrome biogenesis protein CcsB [Candidatus Eremiobacteraceae bacterium]|nr:c-type cytochrome biogenesis protein CcsB [Candidatus Eremiobacteraceae bacterium]
MPDSGNYSQYNSNAAAMLNAHSHQYMEWYLAAVIVYVFAFAVFIGWWFFQNRVVLGAGAVLAVAGVVCQLASLGLRWYYSGHVPWNDLYGSLSVVVLWTVALFLTFGARFKIWYAGPIVFALADMLLAYASGWNKGLEPLVPSLKSYWIVYHVPIVLAAYASFLIAFATSVLFLLKRRAEERAATATWLTNVPPSAKLDVVTYRVVAVGEILLTIGIVLGALWAHDAWGAYWQWDPKETAALVSWLVYAAYLHMHTRPSWRGANSAWTSIVGFASILFCYFGVNIWISGLHSYK